MNDLLASMDARLSDCTTVINAKRHVLRLAEQLAQQTFMDLQGIFLAWVLGREHTDPVCRNTGWRVDFLRFSLDGFQGLWVFLGREPECAKQLGWPPSTPSFSPSTGKRRCEGRWVPSWLQTGLLVSGEALYHQKLKTVRGIVSANGVGMVGFWGHLRSLQERKGLGPDKNDQCHKGTYPPNRNSLTDLGNKLMVTEGEKWR